MNCIKGYRQGEILFIPIDIGDDTAVKIKTGYGMTQKKDMVIREGEVTGHKHEIIGIGAELFEGGIRSYHRENLPEGEMFLTSKNDIVIKHPEHKDLKLDKGNYVIRIQREYDEAEQFRRVLD